MRFDNLIPESCAPFFSLEFEVPTYGSDAENKNDVFGPDAWDLLALQPLFVSLAHGEGSQLRWDTAEHVEKLALKGRQAKNKYLTVVPILTCAGANPKNVGAFLRGCYGAHIILIAQKQLSVDWHYSPRYFPAPGDLARHINNEFSGIAIGVAVSSWDTEINGESGFSPVIELARDVDFIITQFFFDFEKYKNFVDGIRAHGVGIPVIPGIMPVESLEDMEKANSLYNTNTPAELYKKIQRAKSRRGNPETEICAEFTLGLIQRHLAYGAPGVHLYAHDKQKYCKRLLTESGLGHYSHTKYAYRDF